jgi:hypothetical protein
MQMKFELLAGLSESDTKQAIELFADSFEMNETALGQFTYYLNDGREKSYAIVRNEETIVGMFCLLRKRMMYFDIPCNVLGLSYLAISKKHKNPAIRQLLFGQVFEYANSCSDLMLGFARKKIDGFWFPYGFLGFTNFGRLTVELKHLPQLDNSLSLNKCSEADLPTLQSLHRSSYRNLVGSLQRNDSDWQYIFKKSTTYGPLVETIKDQQQNIVGYLVRKGNLVEEIAIDPSFIKPLMSLLHGVLKMEDKCELVHFQTGINHPVSNFLTDHYSYSILTRFAWNGGHVIKINELDKFFEKIKPVLESRLIESTIGSVDFEISFIRFTFSDKTLHLHVLPGLDNFDPLSMGFWQKLILGVLDAEKLCRDCGLAKNEMTALKIMFPLLQPQVSLLDQF